MKTPFTREQFLDVFTHYNIDVFPAQLIFYLIAIIAINFTMMPGRSSGKITSIILSFFWLWMGFVYHLNYFTAINNAAYVFGSLFIVQGFLFIVPGVFGNELSFRYKHNKYRNAGIILLLYALIVYPILGYFQGHIYPSAPTFGLPCPTTIFTFGILLMTNKKIHLVTLIIPFAWSIIGFSAAFGFGIYEDTGLLIAGLTGGTLIFLRNRKYAVSTVTS